MNLLLLNALVWHILFGLVAIISLAGVMLLLRSENLSFKWIKIFSTLGLLGFLASWVSGGYYYSTYYGVAVKPLIVGGSYSWAHKIVMESKEHIFLLLPFLAFVVFAILNFAEEAVISDKKLRVKLTVLCFVTVGIGILIALSGVAISGSVAK